MLTRIALPDARRKQKQEATLLFNSKSTGYKYRTLSTNTGERKRSSTEDNLFDRKFKELKRAMTSRIDKEVKQMAKARESIIEKYEKVDSKINFMIELQDAVTGMRKNLRQTENTLAALIDKVERIELATAGNGSEAYSLLSKRNSFQSPIFEEQELYSSTITHI